MSGGIKISRDFEYEKSRPVFKTFLLNGINPALIGGEIFVYALLLRLSPFKEVFGDLFEYGVGQYVLFLLVIAFFL